MKEFKKPKAIITADKELESDEKIKQSAKNANYKPY